MELIFTLFLIGAGFFIGYVLMSPTRREKFKQSLENDPAEKE